MSTEHPSHRKEIRHAVVELLKGKTDCGDNVFASRVRSVFELELPCILVWTKAEPVKIYTEAPREYEKNLLVAIEILAKGDDDLDDVLDDIASDVEYWMHQDHTKRELSSDTTLKSTEITLDKSGDQLIGATILTYELPYYSEAVRDSDNLRVLARANVKINMKSSDPAASGVDSEDIIEPVTGDI